MRKMRPKWLESSGVCLFVCFFLIQRNINLVSLVFNIYVSWQWHIFNATLKHVCGEQTHTFLALVFRELPQDVVVSADASLLDCLSLMSSAVLSHLLRFTKPCTQWDVSVFRNHFWETIYHPGIRPYCMRMSTTAYRSSLYLEGSRWSALWWSAPLHLCWRYSGRNPHLAAPLASGAD